MTKNRIAWILWALVPVAFIAWHFGPGQEAHARDQAATHLAQARVAQDAEDWSLARDQYAMALDLLPEAEVDARQRMCLAHAKSTIYAGDLRDGMHKMEALLEEVDEDDSELAESTRYELASAGYFGAWLMRLDGAKAEEWKPEARTARQHFRLLAERAAAEGDDNAGALKNNVEAVVRLELMDLSELESLPLPKNCPNCKNCCNSKSKCKSGKCKKPGDGRKKIIKDGAGRSRVSGSGS